MLRTVFGWLPEVALPADKEGVPVAQASGVEERKVKRQRERRKEQRTAKRLGTTRAGVHELLQRNMYHQLQGSL